MLDKFLDIFFSGEPLGTEFGSCLCLSLLYLAVFADLLGGFDSPFCIGYFAGAEGHICLFVLFSWLLTADFFSIIVRVVTEPILD